MFGRCCRPALPCHRSSSRWPLGASLLAVFWTLKGAPIVFEHPETEGAEQKQGPRQKEMLAGLQLRAEAVELPEELVDLYVSLEVASRASSRAASRGASRERSEVSSVSLSESLAASEDEGLPEHVVHFLGVLEAMTKPSTSRSSSRSPSKAAHSCQEPRSAAEASDWEASEQHEGRWPPRGHICAEV